MGWELGQRVEADLADAMRSLFDESEYLADGAGR